MSELDDALVWVAWAIAYGLGTAIAYVLRRRGTEKSRNLRDFLRAGS